jgi:hypothetical protein
VAVHHEDEEVVTNAMPTSLGGIEKGVDLSLGEEVFRPFVMVGSANYGTLDTTPFGLTPQHTCNQLKSRITDSTTPDKTHIL